MTEENKKKNELLSGVDAILKRTGAFEGVSERERVTSVSKPIVEFVYDYCKKHLK